MAAPAAAAPALPKPCLAAALANTLLAAYQALANPANHRLRVADVATRVGFASNAHFSRAFRTAFGIAPSDVRAPGGTGAVGPHLPTAQGSSAEYAAWVRGLQGAGATVG